METNQPQIQAIDSATARNAAPVQPQNPAPTQKPRKSRGMIFGMIFFALLAVCGAVFGVMMMLQKDTESKNYESQISTLKKSNAELVDALTSVPLAVTNANGEEVELQSPVNVNPKDYLYIGEWGIKVKIPDGLKITGYKYDERDFYSLGVDGAAVSLWGTVGDVIYNFAHMEINPTPLGAIVRYPKTTVMNAGSALIALFSDAEWSYYVFGPQVAFSIESKEAAVESSSMTAFSQMISQLNNYSAI